MAAAMPQTMTVPDTRPWLPGHIIARVASPDAAIISCCCVTNGVVAVDPSYLDVVS